MKRWRTLAASCAVCVGCGGGTALRDAGPDATVSDAGPLADVSSEASHPCVPGYGVCCTSADCTPGQTCPEAGSRCACPSAAFNALDSGTAWQSFDMSSVDGGARGFFGAAFDGRHVYFTPAYDGTTIQGFQGHVGRYDTQTAFSAAASWSFFDLSRVNAGATGFRGAAFDGRNVYFSQFFNGTTGSIVAAYDTTATFGNLGSWSLFDVSAVDANARGYAGAVFDGRYVYFVPYGSGAVTRYDTTALFDAASSWAVFDLTTVDPAAQGYMGAAFDGRYVYFTPNYNASGYHGVVARYDTTHAFGSAGSWSTFDVSTVNPGAKGFVGAVYDGRYVYLAPSYDGAAYDGVIARYDTTAAFASSASWTTFDVSTVNPNAAGFWGAAFDGRYFYLVPYVNTIVARYDTTAPFDSTSSYETFDVTTVDAAAKQYWGAAFDGRFVYLVPAAPGGHIVLQFDAKSPACLPNAWNASFF